MIAHVLKAEYIHVSRDCVGSSVFFQAEDGIRDLVRSRGLGDVYKRQVPVFSRNGGAFSAIDCSRKSPTSGA